MRKYIKVQHLGDKLISDLLEGQVVVEEKIDGSQFRIEASANGVRCGSKSVDFGEEMDKNFKKGVELVMSSKLVGYDYGGHTFHIFAEYLQSPHHNTLHYERTPDRHLMIFDVVDELADGSLSFYTPEQKRGFAGWLGFEAIPTLFEGDGSELTQERINEMLKTTSALGKETIEGIVVKNYSKFYDPVKFPYYAGMFKAGKYVRAEFTERNNTEWKAKKGGIEQFLESLAMPARWVKAVQHLKDAGQLSDNMADMRLLIPELMRDFEEEEKEDIKEKLYGMYRKQMLASVQRGFAEWYKQRLLEQQFAE